jgi:hypothetical protein
MSAIDGQTLVITSQIQVFLPAPANEDIVSMLIGQKDIFPVLNGILAIIAKKATGPTLTTPFPSRNDLSKPPPVKRRKFYFATAGAADWDLPYPFRSPVQMNIVRHGSVNVRKTSSCNLSNSSNWLHVRLLQESSTEGKD